MGQCEYYYGKNSNSQVADACESCEAAVSKRKGFEEAMKMVCDRVFCPAAPTFQKFVSDSERIKNEIKHSETNTDGVISVFGGFDIDTQAIQNEITAIAYAKASASDKTVIYAGFNK